MMKSTTRVALLRTAVLFVGLLGATAAPAHGQASALQARLQATLDSLTGPDAYPGIALGVAMDDGASFGLASGWADTALAVPLTPSGRMLQGSVGKTYFGAVALQLVSEGRLDLDAPVRRYLGDEPWWPRIPNGDVATVRQIMSHTSGIVRYEFNPAFLEDLTADPMRTFSPEERLEYLFDTEAPFAAGQGWEYSDTNFVLVAMIIEEITGNSAYDEIRNRLLDPLGLGATVASDRPFVPGLVQGYAGPENPFGGFDAMVTNGRLAINPQFEWGGGGFASSAEDLARWTRAIHQGDAFDASLFDDFRRGTPAPLGPDASYGLGVIMMELPSGTAWGHSGFMPGYRTEAYYFPRLGFALALQVNTSYGPALPAAPLRMLDRLAAVMASELAGVGGAFMP